MQKDPKNPTEPRYADRATFHRLAERFFTRLNGTVWLETASDADAEPTQEKVDAVLKYRDSLAQSAIFHMTRMQDTLFQSCRTAECGEQPLLGEYEAAAGLVKQSWRESEVARRD